MIASLPMYWRAENAKTWQELWAHVQTVDTTLPDLTPPESLPDNLIDHWLDPSLVLSMTCSLPLRTTLRHRVNYVGTLTFGSTDIPGHYRSVVVAHPGLDLQAPLRLAYNAPDSQSGWTASFDAPQFRIAGLIETGAHAASLAAVASGQADVAFLDSTTWQLLKRFDPAATQVEIVGYTSATPALPLITAKTRDPAPLRATLALAMQSLRLSRPADIGGTPQFKCLPLAAYLDQEIPPNPAQRTAARFN